MNKLTKIASCLALSLSGAAFASVAAASTATTTFAVTATVVDSCTVSASSMAFGDYNGLTGGTIDAVGTISPICTLGTAYSVGLSAGHGYGASPTSRVLSGPYGSTLRYGIYTDAARIMPWGDGRGGMGSEVVGSGTGTSQPVMMYGRIPASQGSAVGAYSDTVTVTLTY